MARYTGAAWKVSRRLKFSTLETGKEFAVGKNGKARRDYAPGQHGQRRGKISEYGTQLQEKQKVRFTYGLSEKQFHNTFVKAGKLPGKHGDNFLIKMKPQVFDVTYEDFGVALEKWHYSCIIPAGTTLPASAEKKYSLIEDGQSQLNIKVLSRSAEAQEAQKTYDKGIEFLDELIMTGLPYMKMDDVDVVVRFEITKQYELRTDVSLVKKDGTLVDKGNMSIDRQSML